MSETEMKKVSFRAYIHVQYIPQKRTHPKRLLGELFLIVWHSDITFLYIHGPDKLIKIKNLDCLVLF